MKNEMVIQMRQLYRRHPHCPQLLTVTAMADPGATQSDLGLVGSLRVLSAAGASAVS